MQKERAASALAHGLPVPTPLPTRARGTDSRSTRPSHSGGALRTPLPRPAAAGRGLPLGVKLLGLALGLLGLVYGLTVFREHWARVGASLASGSPSASGASRSAAAPSLGASLNAASLDAEPAASGSVK